MRSSVGGGWLLRRSVGPCGTIVGGRLCLRGRAGVDRASGNSAFALWLMFDGESVHPPGPAPPILIVRCGTVCFEALPGRGDGFRFACSARRGRVVGSLSFRGPLITVVVNPNGLRFRTEAVSLWRCVNGCLHRRLGCAVDASIRSVFGEF